MLGHRFTSEAAEVCEQKPGKSLQSSESGPELFAPQRPQNGLGFPFKLPGMRFPG
jgi:hypothetical protein